MRLRSVIETDNIQPQLRTTSIIAAPVRGAAIDLLIYCTRQQVRAQPTAFVGDQFVPVVPQMEHDLSLNFLESNTCI